MIKKVNPRVGMYESLQLTAELVQPEKIFLLKLFLDKKFNGPVDVLYPVYEGKKIVAVSFRFNGAGHLVREGQYMVKDRKTLDLKYYSEEEYNRIYADYTEEGVLCDGGKVVFSERPPTEVVKIPGLPFPMEVLRPTPTFFQINRLETDIRIVITDVQTGTTMMECIVSKDADKHLPGGTQP